MQSSYASRFRSRRVKMASSTSGKLRTKTENSLGYSLMLFVLVFITCGQTVFAAPAQPISLFVDATDISRGLFHSELAIPVQPGPLTLVYPKWIPGYHAPVGPLNNIVRLKISHNGQPIGWTRDPVDMFAFHLVVPVGVSVLHVAMDVVAPRRPNADLGASTARLFVLEWNEVVLYPQDAATDKVLTRAQIRLPLGWKFACSMSPIRTENGVVEFRQVSLTTLVDSPLLTGEYFRTLALTSTPPVFVDIAADVPGALDVTLEWEARLRRLIAEARALFGGFHFDQYRFLLALSDELGNDGIEHQQSSDNRVGARLFCDEALRLSYGYLLPHEFVHSWNGKYRRPLGLAKRNFQEPQVGDLLWVYEGLTRYLNWVLAARSGIFTPQEARDYVALLAALMDHRSGREWRTLEDTAVSAQLLYGAPEQWQSLRRSMDHYDESLLIWLEADTIIRQKTQGQRSLDDFCRAFFGPQSVPLATDTYVLGHVTTALAVVAPYDWKTFFVTRLNATGTDRVPLEGLTSSGWTLAYGDSAGSVQAARDEIHHTVEERFSLGFLSQEDGTVLDVVRDSPAWKAGLGPGMKLLTVNQRRWSPQVFRDAIAADHNSSIPINLSVQNGLVTFPVAINDHAGASYPRLERNANPDLISEILRPRITTGATP